MVNKQKKNGMKRVAFLLFLVLSGFFMAEAQEKTAAYERYWKPDTRKIRVISYNVFNGFDWGKDRDRQERFVAWIREQDAGVVAMQELCGFTQESLSALAKQWGHPYAVIVKENGYPVGITSKSPIRVKNKILKGCGHGLLHVEILGYDFLVTHLNPNSCETRRQEAAYIAGYIRENGSSRCLLMGDMNSHSPADADYMEGHATDLRMQYGAESANLTDGRFDYSVVSCFLALPLVDVCREYVPAAWRQTFPTPVLMNVSQHPEVREKTGERLDYILVTPEVAKQVVDAAVHKGEDTDYLSDHYPVSIDLLFQEKKE